MQGQCEEKQIQSIFHSYQIKKIMIFIMFTAFSQWNLFHQWLKWLKWLKWFSATLNYSITGTKFEVTSRNFEKSSEFGFPQDWEVPGSCT